MRGSPDGYGSSAGPNGKRRLAGDTARAATSDEVKALRQEARRIEAIFENASELDVPTAPPQKISSMLTQSGLCRLCSREIATGAALASDRALAIAGYPWATLLSGA